MPLSALKNLSRHSAFWPDLRLNRTQHDTQDWPAVFKIQSRIENDFFRFFATLSLIILATGLVAIVDLPPQTPYSLEIQLFPHLEMIAIVIGIAIFPLRRIPWSFLVYAIGFAMTVGILMLSGNVSAQVPFDFHTLVLMSFAANAVAGTLIGIMCRIIIIKLAKHVTSLAPDLFINAAISGTTLVVGSIGIYFTVIFLMQTAELPQANDFAWITVSRVARGVAITSAAMMISFFPPDRNFFMAMPMAFMFIIPGYLNNIGVLPDTPYLVVIVCFVQRMLLPIRIALPIALIGVMGHISLTSIADPPGTYSYHLASVLFVLLVTGDFFIMQRHQNNYRFRTTQDLLRHATQFSGIGFFIMHPGLEDATLDENACKILKTSSNQKIFDLRGRIHPEDAPDMNSVFGGEPGIPRKIVIRICEAPEYREEADLRYIAVNMCIHAAWDGTQWGYGTVQDVTQARQNQDRLNITMAELHKEKDEQSRLFSMITHELHTPAAMIRMLAEDINAGQDWAVNGPKIMLMTDQMMTIMDNVRHAVHPDKPVPPCLEVPFSPVQLMQSVVDDYRLFDPEKHYDVSADPQLSNALRVSDVDKIRKILGNLVQNAILHSHADTVRLLYHEDPVDSDGVYGVWSIQDNGIGIPPELVTQMLKPAKRDTGDTRLGLYIAASSAEHLGGTLKSDPSMKRGTRFILKVPLKQANQA